MAKSALADAKLIHTAEAPTAPPIPPAPEIVSVVESDDRKTIGVAVIFPGNAKNLRLATVIGSASGANPFAGLTADTLPEGATVVDAVESGGTVPVLAHDAEQWVTAFYEVDDTPIES